MWLHLVVYRKFQQEPDSIVPARFRVGHTPWNLSISRYVYSQNNRPSALLNETSRLNVIYINICHTINCCVSFQHGRDSSRVTHLKLRNTSSATCKPFRSEENSGSLIEHTKNTWKISKHSLVSHLNNHIGALWQDLVLAEQNAVQNRLKLGFFRFL